MTIYVHVVMAGPHLDWRTVEANSIAEGMEIAKELPGVIAVLEGSIIPGGVAT